MGKRDDGGPAFPGPKTRLVTGFNDSFPHEETVYVDGMTLRQWYKGMALIGWMSANVGRGLVKDDQVISQVSGLADALIAEDKEARR